MSVPDFKEISHRDAWSTIRGFVYQVDLTILSWIKLKQNEALELERGEDIDHISTDIGQADTRTLEQLKHREAKISLNQQLTLEVLRNFYIHRKNNPGLKIKLRFVTNSDYALERPAIFVDARKGIEVWANLQQQPIDPQNSDLQGIKKHLLKRIAEHSNFEPTDPADIQDEARLWEEFGNHLTHDGNLIAFVEDFEWSVQNTGPSAISVEIIQELEKRFNGQPGRLLYERLFLYVFKLMSIPSIKRLDLAILNSQATLPALSTADQTLFDTLKGLLNDVQLRLQKLEGDTAYGLTQIDGLYRSMDALKSNAAFDLHLNNLSYNPPNLIDKGTPRTEKVKTVMTLFDQTDWVAFHGLNGTGKTQLAALVCQEFSQRFWLDLRELANDAYKAPLVVEAFLTGLSGENVSADRKHSFTQILTRFPKGSLIVFNDIPEVTNHDHALLNTLTALASAISGSGIKLITTSNYQLPVVVSNAATPVIQDFNNFNFSNEEIKECLTNNGAPAELLRYTNLIALRSQRNARLVLAIIYYLKELDWGKDRDNLYHIAFGTEFSNEVLADAQRSISRHILNEQTRELLYRLSLISWDFGLPEARAISEVEVKVPHTNEHLLALNNIWIQQLNSKMYQVSPVINNIGANNLSDTVIKEVHKAYANALIRNNKINQSNATQAILSFVKGEEFDEAGLLLFNFYRIAEKLEQVQSLEKWGYLNYWSDVPLPDKMSITIRVFIKSEQLRFAKMLNRDAAPIWHTIHELLGDPDFPETEAIMIKTLMLSQYPEMEISYFWKYLRFVIEKWPTFIYKDDLNVELSLFSGLLWLPLTSIVSKSDIETWLELIRLFKDSFGENVFDHGIATAAVGLMCSRISTQNPEQLAGAELVQSKLERLELLRAYFEQSKKEILETLVLREQIHVLFTQSNDLDALRSEIEQSLNKAKLSGSKFILTAYFGRMLLRNDYRQEAKIWFERALAYDDNEQSDYMETLISMGNLCADTDKKKSIAYCEKAVENAINRKPYVPIEYMQTLAELGVAYWLDNNPADAFATFDTLVNELFATKLKHFNTEWVRLFSLAGHANGYMSSMIKTGEPPLVNGEDYFTPYIGMFTMDQRDFSDRYNPQNDALIAAQMAFFADGLNDPDKAYEWSLKAFDIARRSKDQASVLMISSTCSQYAVVQFKPEEAFEAYLLFSAVTAHLDGDYRTKYDSLSSIDLEELLKVRPSERWATAEKITFEMAVLPLLIKVLTAYLEDAIYKEDWRGRYLYMIKDYTADASDTLLWDLVQEISIKIIDRTTTLAQLTHRANTFGEQGKKHLQLLCMLGVAFITDKATELAGILLNFIPYLQKVYGKTGSINKYVLLPFIKLYSEKLIKTEFVGSRTELQVMLDQINSINVDDPNAIQKTLQPAIDLTGISTLEDRKRWLYSYEEI